MRNKISFIATHGTGTIIGDLIEIQSIYKVYGNNRKDNLYLGAIKTCIGHTESTAGIMNIIFCLLVILNKQVPAITNLDKISTKISEIIDDKIIIPYETQNIKNTKIYTAANSFGLGGTNSHIIISSYNNDNNKINNTKYNYNKQKFDIFPIYYKIL